MPANRIVPRPGINTQLSQTLGKGGFFASNLVRFRNGVVEKLGGWLQLVSQHVVGTVRKMHAWADLTGITYLAYGSEQRLQVYSSGSVTDITPIRRTINAANILSTVIGTNVITVFDTAHGAAAGDSIIIPIPVAIGGLVLFGNYTVATVTDANHYTFLAASNATATVNLAGTLPGFSTTIATNVVNVNLPNHGLVIGNIFTVQVSVIVGGLTILGQYLVNTVVDVNNFTILASSVAGSTAGPVLENSGQVRIQYLISSGYASDTALTGWGGGPYGGGPYGQSGGGTIIIPLRNWSLDNFGQNLEAVYTNGPLYEWIPPVTLGNTAAIVANAPTVNWGMFIQMPAQQIVLIGSSVSGVQDPMLVAWCDAGNNTVWTASAVNQAGTFRLPRGSKIVNGMMGPHTGFIWTDVGLWSMSYTGQPFIYDFEELGVNCGLIAKNAAAMMGDNIYWMSTRQFFRVGANGIEVIPCDVWDFVFKNLNLSQLNKITCAPSTSFNEVTWFFPSASGNGEIDSYVKYNILDRVWDYGSLIRTAWIDQSVLGTPIGVDGPNGLLQQHEISVDANGSAMTGVSVLTDYVDISDGGEYMHLQYILPDFVWTGSANLGASVVQVTVFVVDYPGDTPVAFGPFNVVPSTQYLTIDCRGRQVAMQITSSGAGVAWRYGAFRFVGAPDGRQ